jgi:hypothetical protein
LNSRHGSALRATDRLEQDDHPMEPRITEILDRDERYSQLLDSEVSELAAAAIARYAGRAATTGGMTREEDFGELASPRYALDDDALDADFSVDDFDIDDMFRGGK